MQRRAEGTYANDLEAFGGCFCSAFTDSLAAPLGILWQSVGRKLKINHFTFYFTMANNNSGLVATCFGPFPLLPVVADTQTALRLITTFGQVARTAA